MYKSILTSAIALTLASGLVNAKPIKTSNQAVTACKSHLKSTVPGFKRAKLGQIRNSRDKHKLTFSVSSNQGRSKTKCIVDKKDGAIALTN